MGEEIYIGEGMRMFWSDGNDKPILELNEIEFIHADEAEETEAVEETAEAETPEN